MFRIFGTIFILIILNSNLVYAKSCSHLLSTSKTARIWSQLQSENRLVKVSDQNYPFLRSGCGPICIANLSVALKRLKTKDNKILTFIDRTTGRFIYSPTQKAISLNKIASQGVNLKWLYQTLSEETGLTIYTKLAFKQAQFFYDSHNLHVTELFMSDFEPTDSSFVLMVGQVRDASNNVLYGHIHIVKQVIGNEITIVDPSHSNVDIVLQKNGSILIDGVTKTPLLYYQNFPNQDVEYHSFVPLGLFRLVL